MPVAPIVFYLHVYLFYVYWSMFFSYSNIEHLCHTDCFAAFILSMDIEASLHPKPQGFLPWWAPYPVLNNDGHLDPAQPPKFCPSPWDTGQWVPVSSPGSQLRELRLSDLHFVMIFLRNWWIIGVPSFYRLRVLNLIIGDMLLNPSNWCRSMKTGQMLDC